MPGQTKFCFYVDTISTKGIGSLRSYDCYCNESITLKNFALGLSVSRLFRVGHVLHHRRSRLWLVWHKLVFMLGQRMKNLLQRCRVVVRTSKMLKFHVVIWQTSAQNCTKGRAARAARLFLFVQPIKALICGVVVAVAVVIS